MNLHRTIRVAAVALLLGATALSTATFAAQVPEGTKLADEQVFNFRILDNVTTLDPNLVEDVDTAVSLVGNLFEGLYNEDFDGNPVPGTASSYDVNADNTVYTFHLRDAKWSNGDPVKASDFVFSWRRAVDPATASNYSYYLGLIGVKNADDIVAGKMPLDALGVKAIDDKTLEVDLSRPVPYFVRTTAHPTLFPVPEAVVTKFGKDWTKPENIVGNGAYMLQDLLMGERTTLKRNPNYWDDAHTVINTVNVLTVNDDNAGVTRYLAGELDYTEIPNGQYPAFKEQYPNEVQIIQELSTYYLAINVGDKASNEALKDARVRQAISLAIDRDTIVNKVLQAGQSPAYGFAPPAVGNYTAPDLEYATWTQAQRNEKAKQLMTEAGYGPDNPVTFNYIYNNSVGHQQIATVVGQMLNETLGVVMQPEGVEFQSLLDRRHASDYEVARDGWIADYNEASTFLGLLASDSSQNDSHYANAQVDDWLKQAASSKDPTPFYKQVEEQVAKDVPIIPIYYYTKSILLKANLKGWPLKNGELIWYAKDLYKTAE